MKGKSHPINDVFNFALSFLAIYAIWNDKVSVFSISDSKQRSGWVASFDPIH